VELIISFHVTFSSWTSPDTIGDAGRGDLGAVLLPDVIDEEQEEIEADPEEKNFDGQKQNLLSGLRIGCLHHLGLILHSS